MPVSVVIPACNEEQAIAQTVLQLHQVLERSVITDWEVIVLDDGSTDETARVAAEHGARVIRHLQTLGYGKSIKDGIQAAKYDVIAIMDADGTYPVGQLPTLLAKFYEGYDMVIGRRTGPYYRESLIKSPLRWVLKWLVEFTAGRSIPDVNSGFRVFDRREAMNYFSRLCDTFSFTTSLTLVYLMNNRYVAHVPIEYKERVGKSKVVLVKDSLRTLQYIVQAILYYDPIKIFVVMSGIAVIFSCMSFAVTLMFGLLSTFLLGIGGLLAAMLIFALGLLASLLQQIMNK
jgi:glycosyltransferase involved in cell wall biosynthesis